METILSSEFKRQMVLMLEGGPHVIEDLHTSGTAQTRHKLHTRLRHLTTGRISDRVFSESERVPVAPLETRRVTYSYAKGDRQVFSDLETFDEYEFSNEQLGERRWFLKGNEEYKALRLDGRLLDLVLPPQLPLKVVDTAPPTRAGADGAWKEAKLETGLQIMVPLFIANGDIIRVDIAGKEYLGKATTGGLGPTALQGPLRSTRPGLLLVTRLKSGGRTPNCHWGFSVTANAIIRSPTEMEQCWPGRAVIRESPSSENVPSALVTPTLICIRLLPSDKAVGVTTQFVPPPRSKWTAIPL